MNALGSAFVGGLGTGLGLAVATLAILLLAAAVGSDVLRKAVGQ